MNPKRRVLMGACALATFAALAAAPASAQFYDDARRALDLGPDPIARSPRMVGMGRLSLVLDDPHHRFDIWEFSGNPAGLFESDTSSAFELTPATAANSTVHDDMSGTATRERQDFALREVRFGYEAWRRTNEGAAFGLIGELDRLRTDSPQSQLSETRSEFTMPRTAFVISGKMPLFGPERLRYGLAIRHRYQSMNDESRTIVSNAAGDYLDKDGITIDPPVTITPTHYGIRSGGLTTGIQLDAASWLKLAGAYEYLGNSIEGRDDAPRNTSEIRETRPYGTLSASAAGTLAGRLSFVGDVSHWSSGRTDQRWVASYSTGTGAAPVLGRGLLQRRDETGRGLRGRMSWIQGSLTVSAGGSTFHRDVETHVPPIGDITSFNYFLDRLSARPGADSLSLPDSLRSDATKETGSEVGFGAALRLPWRHSTLGAEYHQERSTFDQLLSGPGPDRKAWDARTGIEVPLSQVLTLRTGYIYRWLDEDQHLAQDEFVSHSITGGFGLRPRGASWTFESGYQVRWGKADFGDPTRIRSSEQSGVCRIRWTL